jgi:uncharacterized protein YaaR (DUF327 family)
MARISGMGGGRPGGPLGSGKVKDAKAGSGSGVKKENKINITHNAFVDAMNEAEVNYEKEDLEKSIEEIDRIARDLTRNPSMKLLEEYKRMVSAFLKDVLRKIYKVETKEGLPKYGREQKIYINITNIDKALEDLTMKFMKGQSDAISLISDVEGISGMLYNTLI